VLADDGMLVGWGTQPYITEFARVETSASTRSSTVTRGTTARTGARGSAHPRSRCAIAVRRHVSAITVYASWNGSTKTASGAAGGGSTKTVPATGFETAIELRGRPPASVTVTALDARHRPLVQRTATVSR
jgi:hypothetical protein